MEVSTQRAPLRVEIWADPALIASRMVCTVVKAADKTSLRANRAAKAMLRYFYQTERPRLHRHESANVRSKPRVQSLVLISHFQNPRKLVPQNHKTQDLNLCCSADDTERMRRRFEASKLISESPSTRGQSRQMAKWLCSNLWSCQKKIK